MRFYTAIYGENKGVFIGYKNTDFVYALPNYSNMNELLESITDDELNTLQTAPKTGAIPLCDLTLCAPIEYPAQDIICLGVNYADHAKESEKFKGGALNFKRTKTVYFAKHVNKATANGAQIPAHTDIVESLDYEVELAVVLNKTAYKIKEENANEHIFGYTIMNDVSARNVQSAHNQWFFGKSLDGFAPLGPCIVTKDEFTHPLAINVRSYVNGELRQNSNTSLFLTTIPEAISELSQGMTLKQGTIIATGTPAGVGMGFTPPKWLNIGDEIICEIEGIGKLTNIVGE